MQIYQILNNDVTLLVTTDIEAAKQKLAAEVLGSDRFGYPCYEVWENGVRIESFTYFQEEWTGDKFRDPAVDLRTDILKEAQNGSLEKFYAFGLAVGIDLIDEYRHFKGVSKEDLKRITTYKNSEAFQKILEDYKYKVNAARVELGLRTDGYTLQDRLRDYAKAEVGSNSLSDFDPDNNDRSIF